MLFVGNNSVILLGANSSPKSNALMYWSSLKSSRDDAYVFTSEDGYLSYSSYADVSRRTEFAIRPAFVEYFLRE